ncbi:hypothetical protein FQN50_007045 [Emmonsiellopsis sp. PD_5]|nr:hypothetical protein FQN50_007045 [Emmonsiellopsis sp. PD_5]
MPFHLLPRLPLARPLLLAVPLGIGLGFAAPSPISSFFAQSSNRAAVYCDSPAPFIASGGGYAQQTQSPLSKTVDAVRSRGGISETAARQISLGSVLGLFVGIGLRIFSRALVFAVGMGILAVQFAASKGYNIVPTRWLQQHIKSVDVKRLTTENVPFKVSFAVMMMLSAFSKF